MDYIDLLTAEGWKTGLVYIIGPLFRLHETKTVEKKSRFIFVYVVYSFFGV